MLGRPRLTGFAAWCAACIAALNVGGCSQINQMSSHLSLGQGDLTVDQDDVCGAQRRAFSNSRSYFTSSLVKTASAVFLGNAASSTSSTAGGTLQGVMGNVVNGFASGGSSYFKTMSTRFTNPQLLTRGILKDLTTEEHQIDQTNANFTALRDCRFRGARRIRSDSLRGQISRATANERLGTERHRFDEEIALAQELGVTMQHREEEFQQAASDLQHQPAPQSASGGATAPNPHRAANSEVEIAATKTVPEKRASFENSVGAASTESQIAFNLDPSTQSRWPELDARHA